MDILDLESISDWKCEPIFILPSKYLGFRHGDFLGKGPINYRRLVLLVVIDKTMNELLGFAPETRRNSIIDLCEELLWF